VNPAVELSLASVTWRILLGRRRWLALLFCNGLPCLMAWAFVVEQGDARPDALNFTEVLYAAVVLSVLLPLASLIFGAMAAGQEIEDGTLAYSLAKPIARWRIVVAKVLVAWTATLVSTLPGVWLAGWMVLESPTHPLVRAFTVGAALAALLYSAGFLALSLFTRRALIIGLLYVIAWEGSLSRLFMGTRTLSVREYATTVTEAISGVSLMEGLGSPLRTPTAATLSAIVLALVVGVAISRLKGLELAEEI
jgi:ABC-2 type transport system permease protein